MTSQLQLPVYHSPSLVLAYWERPRNPTIQQNKNSTDDLQNVNKQDVEYWSEFVYFV